MEILPDLDAQSFDILYVGQLWLGWPPSRT